MVMNYVVGNILGKVENIAEKSVLVNFTAVECVTVVLSLVAIIVSVATAIANYQKDVKIAKMNIQFAYFQEIYKRHLIKEIPTTRGYMWIDAAGYLQDEAKFIEELNQIRRDSLYFSYEDKQFYSELKIKLQNLDDYVLRAKSKPMLGGEQTAFMDQVENDLKGIYELISKACFSMSKK